MSRTVWPRIPTTSMPPVSLPDEHREWVTRAAERMTRQLQPGWLPCRRRPRRRRPGPDRRDPGPRAPRRGGARAGRADAGGRRLDEGDAVTTPPAPAAHPVDTPARKRVLLHVGTPKTGTSYLQDVLFRNREVLRGHGILYPADRFDGHFLAALDLMRLTWGGLETQAVGAWDRLAEQVRAWPGTSIVSHEILSTASPTQIDRALDVLRRGRRGAPHRLGARPGPAGAGRVAGERQAPQPGLLRPLPGDDPRPRPRHPDRLVVLGRAGDPRHPRPLGRDPAARAGAPGDRAAARVGPRRAVAALQPRLRPRRAGPRPHPRARQPVARGAGDGAAAAGQQARHAGRRPARLPPAGARAAGPPDPVATHVQRPPRPPARPCTRGCRTCPGPGSRRWSGAGTTSSATSPTSSAPRPRPSPTPTRRRPTTCCRPPWTRSPRCSSRAPGCASRRPTWPASSTRPATSWSWPGARPPSGPSRPSRRVPSGVGRWASTGSPAVGRAAESPPVTAAGPAGAGLRAAGCAAAARGRRTGPRATSRSRRRRRRPRRPRRGSGGRRWWRAACRRPG